ncbi:hypothetical protein AAMO2058_000688000 [Amorphochlora amoebiformis]
MQVCIQAAGISVCSVQLILCGLIFFQPLQTSQKILYSFAITSSTSGLIQFVGWRGKAVIPWQAFLSLNCVHNTATILGILYACYIVQLTNVRNRMTYKSIRNLKISFGVVAVIIFITQMVGGALALVFNSYCVSSIRVGGLAIAILFLFPNFLVHVWVLRRTCVHHYKHYKNRFLSRMSQLSQLSHSYSHNPIMRPRPKAQLWENKRSNFTQSSQTAVSTEIRRKCTTNQSPNGDEFISDEDSKRQSRKTIETVLRRPSPAHSNQPRKASTESKSAENMPSSVQKSTTSCIPPGQKKIKSVIYRLDAILFGIVSVGIITLVAAVSTTWVMANTSTKVKYSDAYVDSKNFVPSMSLLACPLATLAILHYVWKGKLRLGRFSRFTWFSKSKRETNHPSRSSPGKIKRGSLPLTEVVKSRDIIDQKDGKISRVGLIKSALSATTQVQTTVQEQQTCVPGTFTSSINKYRSQCTSARTISTTTATPVQMTSKISSAVMHVPESVRALTRHQEQGNVDVATQPLAQGELQRVLHDKKAVSFDDEPKSDDVAQLRNYA